MVIKYHSSIFLRILNNVSFPSEFNHVLNDNGDCVLVPGAQPLPSDGTCSNGDEYWYERTAYRKIRYSTCEGGITIHQGDPHNCPGIRGHGFFFWVFVLFFPTAIALLVGFWVYKRSGFVRGYV